MTQQLTLIAGEPDRKPVIPIAQDIQRSARIGLRQARAALAEANRRVAERESQRLAEREEALVALSDAARRLALVASAPQQPRAAACSEIPEQSSQSAA
ncbi:MAG: hypothetical protein WD029_09415 [Microthrixaceae bacterium]